MRSRRQTIAVGCGAFMLAIGVDVCAAARQAAAQPLNALPAARAPCSVLSGRPCHPSFCGVFHRGPCFPEYWPPLGETLRLTVVSTDDNPTGASAGGADDANKSADAEDHGVDNIRQMFAALRSCWQPPPKDEARHGMEYTIRFALKRDGALVAPPRRTYSSHDAPVGVRDTYRDAVGAALDRCLPLHLSESMGDAVAGRPIAIRFVDDRTIDKDRGQP
jgi:hypothetical protein